MLTGRWRWGLVIGAGLVLILVVVGFAVAWLLEGWNERGLQSRILSEITLDGVVFESATSPEIGRGFEAHSRETVSKDVDFRTVGFGELESDLGVGLQIDVWSSPV